MILKHRITINVTDPWGKTGAVLKGAGVSLPARRIGFLSKDFTQMYLPESRQMVEAVDVKEVKKGGNGNGKEERACSRTYKD